ncbi:sigma-70 family RNA polymerase sigma factor [Candidatus Sumerlaeota bacterium]|nr:sigma-70 family RNA polymerase sigma factor [Candidatus Sumerlaeota bacterium]
MRTTGKGDMPAADDQILMRQLQEGDQTAFEQIVRHWEQPMLNFFYRSVGDLDAAEDLRQDLFVRLYTYRSSYRGDGTFRAWLYQLATNLLRSYLRRPRPAFSLDGDTPDSESERLEMHDQAPRASEIIQRQQSEQIVRQMLDGLSPDDREALVLRFFEGLPYGEICQALGIAESSAKSRVYRAIERLRKMIARQGLTASDLL